MWGRLREQAARNRGWRWTRRWGAVALGWLLLALGLAALFLPGPGLLMLAAGLAVLSQEYEWAERRLHPVKKRAFEAAAFGVRTWPRICLSTLGGLWLIALGLVWGVGVRIPTWWVFGPQLPFQGWGVASSLILSGLIALGLLVYALRRFRGLEPSDVAVEADVDSEEFLDPDDSGRAHRTRP